MIVRAEFTKGINLSISGKNNLVNIKVLVADGLAPA